MITERRESWCFYMAYTFLARCYERCMYALFFSFFFCRCQMCLHPLPCSPFPSLWFLHGRRVSIRASRLQEPEHSSLSVLPREVQPCLGRCICSPGASRGKEGEPWGLPCMLVSLEVRSCQCRLTPELPAYSKYSSGTVSAQKASKLLSLSHPGADDRLKLS